jgi:hypothetical protein
MSLQVEVARSRRAQRTHQKQTERKKRQAAPLPALPAVLNDAQVLRFKEWCGLNRVSERTGRRILASGNGPVTTQLSAKLIGITVRANREWQASRARS